MQQSQVLNFRECANLIAAVGKNITVLIRGETGIGKSSLGTYLQKTRFPNHDLAIADVTTMTEGDVGLPWKVEINGRPVTVFAPNEFLGLHLDKPIILMLDELPKGSKGVVDMLMPLMLERRFGKSKLHPDSIVFASGNLSWEGLGDSFMPHQLNRIMDVYMRKPRLVDDSGKPVEWLKDFAIPNLCPPSAIAFASEYPRIFADYGDSEKANPYIHKPGEVTGQFVTPRSFWKLCSEHLPQRGNMGPKEFYAGMVGLVGLACATDFEVFLQTEADLPSYREAVDDPYGCRLCERPVERMMMTYRMAQNVSGATIDAAWAYVQRMQGEFRALWVELVATQAHTMSLTPKLFALGAVADNQDLRTA